jgi:hypothetical protein
VFLKRGGKSAVKFNWTMLFEAQLAGKRTQMMRKAREAEGFMISAKLEILILRCAKLDRHLIS